MHKCGVDGHIDNLLMILSYLRLNELTTNQVNALLNTIDKSGYTPLMLVQFLCECSEVELNEGDSFGMTALQHTINSGDKSMITSLSSAGASLKPINRHDDENESNCFWLFDVPHCLFPLSGTDAGLSEIAFFVTKTGVPNFCTRLCCL